MKHLHIEAPITEGEVPDFFIHFTRPGDRIWRYSGTSEDPNDSHTHIAFCTDETAAALAEDDNVFVVFEEEHTDE